MTARDPGGKQRWREFEHIKQAHVWRARAKLDTQSMTSGKRRLQKVWDDFLLHQTTDLKRTTLANWKQSGQRGSATFALSPRRAEVQRLGFGASIGIGFVHDRPARLGQS